jgi:hypothetical protein
MNKHKKQPAGNPKVVKTRAEAEEALRQLEEDLNKEDLPKILTPEETEIKINEVLDSWTKENN